MRVRTSITIRTNDFGLYQRFKEYGDRKEPLELLGMKMMVESWSIDTAKVVQIEIHLAELIEAKILEHAIIGSAKDVTL